MGRATVADQQPPSEAYEVCDRGHLFNAAKARIDRTGALVCPKCERTKRVRARMVRARGRNR
jgi:hypothetical protein